MRYEVDIAESQGAPLVVDADDPRQAARRVISQGKTPLAVRLAHRGWRATLSRPVGGTRGMDDATLALFAQQLAELIEAGVTLEQGLSLLSQQEAGEAIAALAERLLTRVRNGAALSQSLTEEPGMPGQLPGMVQGAETAGALGPGLAAAAASLARQADTARRVRAVLAYPALLLTVAMCATVFILVGVIPEFAPLFSGEEARLPWVTRVVLFLSGLLTHHLMALTGAAALLAAAAVVMLRARNSQRAAILGALSGLAPVKYALRLDAASALAVLGSLLQNGVDSVSALTHAAHASRTRLTRDALLRGATHLREGGSISGIFADMHTLPATTRLLIGVGEGTGDMGRAIAQAARLLDADTQRRIDRLLGILNPAAVIVLGVVIAFLIAGLMLGILSINQLALK